ncbi:MAG: RNA polymerase sigma factor [Armatimonadota bacterium]
MAEADRELIARARRGDRRVWERLAQAHRREVYRIAWAILGSDDDAQDATQEALVRMLRGLGGFDQRGDFWARLRRIAVNCALNVLRRRPKAWGTRPRRAIPRAMPRRTASSARCGGRWRSCPSGSGWR